MNRSIRAELNEIVKLQDIIKEDDLNNNSFKSRLSPIKKNRKTSKK